MVMAMFLAHLVGDYVLQWDELARWKSREMSGVIAHSVIVFAVTAFMAGLFDPTWWRGVLLISLSHFAIDALSLYSNRLSIRPLRRYMIDQILHIAFIILALIMGGYLEWGQIPQGILASAAASPALTALTGYIFITMPAWVLLKFVVYGMMNGQAPNFPAGPNKFVGISERIVITTLVISGQFLFVPLVALPHVLMDWPRVADRRDHVYLAEFIGSVLLAVGVGLGLSALVL